ncbi:MAG: hypothetical protein ACJAS4_003951, partial [Bacteriovoracaceae bacterium]
LIPSVEPALILGILLFIKSITDQEWKQKKPPCLSVIKMGGLINCFIAIKAKRSYVNYHKIGWHS